MTANDHKLCMIPGPVEFDSVVLDKMATPATSHVDPGFIHSFGNALGLMKQVWDAPNGQPVVVAGSGTLTWDIVGSNLIVPGDAALVVNSGVFGDWFGECLEVYGADVDHVKFDGFGNVPSLERIKTALSAKKYKLVTITHVDTSTGVLMDIQAVASIIHSISPESLIVVDGVCSVAAEEIRMQEWGLDVVLTASQKAIGVPPGLGLLVFSERAINVAENRPGKPTSYFANVKKWLPIMRKYEAHQPCYFATPPVQLILALEQSLKTMVESGMTARFQSHVSASNKIKDALESLGLKLVPVDRKIAAHSLTSCYYPQGVNPADFLKEVGLNGVVIAGGLFPGLNTTYFRVGHMNVSVTQDNGHVEKTIEALSAAVKKLQLPSASL